MSDETKGAEPRRYLKRYDAPLICKRGCCDVPDMCEDQTGDFIKFKDHNRIVAEMEEKLRIAVDYLKQGKKKFAPNTTNSDVDVFISDYESKIKGGE